MRMKIELSQAALKYVLYRKKTVVEHEISLARTHEMLRVLFSYLIEI